MRGVLLVSVGVLVMTQVLAGHALERMKVLDALGLGAK